MTVSKKVRDVLRERSSGDPQLGLCEICGNRGNNAHHRKNQSQGGTDTLSNLMLLCGSGTTGCHGRVTTNPEWAQQYGYTVRSHQTPATTKVWRHSLFTGRGEWVYLDDNGDVRREAA